MFLVVQNLVNFFPCILAHAVSRRGKHEIFSNIFGSLRSKCVQNICNRVQKNELETSKKTYDVI